MMLKFCVKQLLKHEKPKRINERIEKITESATQQALKNLKTVKNMASKGSGEIFSTVKKGANLKRIKNGFKSSVKKVIGGFKKIPRKIGFRVKRSRRSFEKNTKVKKFGT